MILAYPVATPEIRRKYMGLHGGFERSIQALKHIGFNAAEVFTCDPDSFDAAEIESILAHYSMHVAAVGTSHILNQEGLSLMGASQEKCAAAMRRIHSVIRFAAKLKAPVSIGKVRGNMVEPGNPDERRKFAGALKDLCAFAADQRVDILIEPQNRANINNINSVAEACQLIDAVNLPNLRLHLDTYHLDLTEDDPAESIRSAQGKICFMHLSDSDRKIPGEGSIDLFTMLKALSSQSYGGALSFEIEQGDSPLQTAQRAFVEAAKILERIRE
jgi:sugar phosphate isomerase/epimerase